MRLITNSTNQRTLLASLIAEVALNHKAALLQVGYLHSGKPPEEPTSALQSPASYRGLR